MNIQSRLQYRTARLKIKLFDNAVRKKSLDIRVIRLSVIEDRYSNKEYSLIDHGTVDIIVKIPGGDLQAFQGQRTNNATYNGGVSVYSLLPIEAWTTSDCSLSKDDILLYKILTKPYDDSEMQVQLQALQVTNILSRATNTILYNKYVIAPYSFNMDEYPEIQTIIEQYQLEAIEL